MERIAAGLLCAGLALCAAARAQTGTILLLDSAYDHGADSATRPEAAFPVREGTPADWTAPADYSRGTAWFRLEVRGKPTLTALRIQPCLDQTLAQGGKRSCASAQILSDTGVYAWSVPMSQWTPALAWRSRPARVAIVLQDAYGRPVDPAAADWVGTPYASLYYPLKARISAALVPANGTFAGWDALLPTALARRGPDAGFALRAAGGTGVEIRFAPARALDAEARCWDARGRSLARAAWRAGPGAAAFLLPLAPGSRSAPAWVELRAGGRRWVSALPPRP